METNARQITPEDRLDHALNLIARLMAIAGSIAALLILTDYALPGNKVREPVQGSAAELSSSHRNAHLAYKVTTSNYSFYCKKDFLAQINHSDTVTLHLSPLFEATNSYFCKRFMLQPETFSLRYISGLALPVLMLVVTLLLWRIRNDKLHFLAFVLSLLNLITLFVLI